MQRTFLGIDIPNWVALIGLTITVFLTLLGASSRVTAIEVKTIQNQEQINSCKIDIKETKNTVSEISGDIKAINGKMDIILERVK